MKRYYSLFRPITPGAYPNPIGNPVLQIVNFDDRLYIPEIKREAWGYLDYENSLTVEQMEAFELVAASDREDKERICKLLCKVLQLTRGASDLKSLDFNPETEIVTAVFEGGSRY